MQTLTFNKRTWHYELAKFGGFDRWEDQDLCTYTRKFIRGVFQSLFIGVLIAMFGFGLAHFMLGVIFSAITGAWVMSEIGAVFGLILGVLLLFIAIGASVEKYKDGRETRQAKPDNFVKNAYKGWKEKYCIKINVVDSYES